ncbi:hypothetical protein D3C76_1169870 [compost metagenome]
MHAVQRGDGEGAALGQRRVVRIAAVEEVFLVDAEFTAVDVEAIDGHPIVIVVDLQHQVRSAGIAVRIGDGVGEGFGAVATTMQRFEIRIRGRKGVGIRTVGVQGQRAVSTDEVTASNRARVGAGWDAVGALHVVTENIAAQRQIGFRGRASVGVVHALRQVINDVDVECGISGAAVVIDHRDSKLLGQ